MKKIIFIFISIFALSLVSSCFKDLETKPNGDFLSLEDLLVRDPQAVEGMLSRLYASYALSGPNGPGSSDVSDDPGESPFLRGIVNLQDFTADGIKNRWGDNGLDQLTTTSGWDANNKFFKYLYNRIYYTIPQCNNFLIVLNNVNINNKAQIIAEVKFIRALSYYYLIDVFGKGVLATEENYGQSAPLPESSRVQLFAYTETQLLEAIADLPLTSTYGKANKSAARMLLAKLYLNAEVYIGQNKYTEALAQINKVITEGGYTLDPNFVRMFSGDNNTSPEIIYPIIADSQTSQSYGNTTYITNGGMSTETMPIADFGLSESWGGHRATKAWYGLFGNSATELTASSDVRAHLFWTTGHEWEMDVFNKWKHGYPSIKFRNSNYTGTSVPTKFSNTDFPLFRLADAYLMYAECVLRGATGGSSAQALTYVNNVRQRAGAATITSGQLTLDFILDERARELNFEGHRRTDLIRFGKFTGSTYVWPWKGNVKNGTAIPEYYKLFPIPIQALGANPNLTQNPGF